MLLDISRVVAVCASAAVAIWLICEVTSLIFSESLPRLSGSGRPHWYPVPPHDPSSMDVTASCFGLDILDHFA
jgi:hypothetical protein